jgi:hypothetical protein
MSVDAIIMMVLILTIVWGGFGFALWQAVKQEKKEQAVR